MVERQAPEQHRVDDAEDGRQRPDGDGQGEDDDGGESGTAEQRPHGRRQILAQRVHELTRGEWRTRPKGKLRASSLRVALHWLAMRCELCRSRSLFISGTERAPSNRARYSEKMFSSGLVVAALSLPRTRRTNAGHQSCCSSRWVYWSSAAHVFS